jgi:hypothetical protein
MVTNVVYLGSGLQLTIHLAFGRTVTALVANTDEDTAGAWTPGTPVTCHLPSTALRVLANTEVSAPAPEAGRVGGSEPATHVP